MSDAGKPLGWASDLGLTIHEVLRYAYGGLLAYLVAAIVSPTSTKDVVESLGTTLSVLTAFALGAAIYAFQRPVSEFLYWAHEWLHYQHNKLTREFTCRGAYFRQIWEIPLWLSGDAFRVIRDDKAAFSDSLRKRFHLQHSELHTLYVTFWVLLIGAIAAWIKGGTEKGSLISGWWLFPAAFLALASGFFGNILVCRQECKVLLLAGDETIGALLKKAEFVKDDA